MRVELRLGRVVLLVQREPIATVRDLAELEGRAVVVAGQSMAGWSLAGTVKHGLRTAFADGTGAAQVLLDGQMGRGGAGGMQALQASGRLKDLFAAQHVSWHL